MAEDKKEAVITPSAAARYTSLTTERGHFIERGALCASLTIPTIFQKNVTVAKNMKIKDPAQSVGARGVNTMASKMVLSLMPMNTPFFKLNLDELSISEDGADAADLKTEVLKGLAVLERQTLRDIENSGDVTVVFDAMKQLLCVGNVLMFVGQDGSRAYDLNKYVVVRDPQGKVLEIVIAEEVSPMSLDEATRKLIADKANTEKATGKVSLGSASADKTVTLYTRITFKDGRVKWHQEVQNTVVEGSSSDVPAEANPWMALRFMRVDGEDYGRSYVEMYLGDLISLETLTKAVTDGAVAATKILYLVRPNGTTSPQVIAKAPNMAVRTGDANDVTILRLDKAADMRVAQEMIVMIKKQLAYAFMLNAEVLRDSERVTAEEVRFVAQELDDSLGGIYSMLSKEFQLPYVSRRLHLMRLKSNLPKLPATVSTAIVTGFAALGRGHDRDKLLRFFDGVDRLLKNPLVGKYLSIDEAISRLAISEGIDTKDLQIDATARKATEEADTQDQQQTELMGKLGPEVLKQAGPVIQQQMTQGNTPDGEAQPTA